MITETRLSFIQHRVAEIEKLSQQNGLHANLLLDDTISKDVGQDEIAARLDRVREEHAKLRAELNALARELAVLRETPLVA